MKQRALLSLLILAALPFLSCTLIEVVTGSGVVVSEARTIQAADSVVLKGIGDLQIALGNETSLVVEGEENILPYVRTRVENRLLEIEVIGDGGPVVIMPTRPLRYVLTVPDLTAVETLGSGNIEVHTVAGTAVSIRSTGSGNVRLRSIQASSVVVKLTGSGDVEADGAAPLVQVFSYGSGRALLSNLQAREAEVTLSGSGDAFLRVSDRLNAKSYGSGRVLYYGTPQVDSVVLGSGTVGCLGAM